VIDEDISPSPPPLTLTLTQPPFAFLPSVVNPSSIKKAGGNSAALPPPPLPGAPSMQASLTYEDFAACMADSPPPPLFPPHTRTRMQSASPPHSLSYSPPQCHSQISLSLTELTAPPPGAHAPCPCTLVPPGRQIRNTGTLGGNIATASPISDLNPLWMAFGATFTVISQEGGTRTLPAAKFFLGYRCGCGRGGGNCVLDTKLLKCVGRGGGYCQGRGGVQGGAEGGLSRHKLFMPASK